MGYLILNTDRDDEMKSLRHNMRRMYRHDGTMPMMRHDGSTKEHYYRMGYKHAVEDMDDDWCEDEYYRRARDSRGRYV